MAEDNPINQRIVTGMLKTLGHTGVIVSDGEKALKCLHKLPFDLVLMDVMMPLMDGLEAVAAIRAEERVTGEHLPIIMATAHTEPDDATRFKRAGADGYLAKPLVLNELSAEIRRVVK